MTNNPSTNSRPPIFLLGSHKSGSSLLRSLLDGHPQLAVLPKETHLFQFTNHWVNYRRRRNLPRPLERGELLESLLRRIREDSVGDDPYGDAPNFAGYRMEILESRLRPLDPIDVPNLFRVYMHAAYEAAVGIAPASDIAIVEKSVEHAEFAYVLANYFPGARFVHIVRNPYATLVALRRTAQRLAGRYPFMWPLILSLNNSYYHLFNNRLAVPHYMCIRFEDLVSDTEKSMREIAEFLGIDYMGSLLRPTSMGKAWSGNSTSDQAFQGVSQGPVDGWRSNINDYEIALALLAAKPVFQEFNYEVLTGRHPFWRAKSERLKTYVANRFVLSMGV